MHSMKLVMLYYQVVIFTELLKQVHQPVQVYHTLLDLKMDSYLREHMILKKYSSMVHMMYLLEKKEQRVITFGNVDTFFIKIKSEIHIYLLLVVLSGLVILNQQYQVHIDFTLDPLVIVNLDSKILTHYHQ